MSNTPLLTKYAPLLNLLVLVSASLTAQADDASLSFGGSPHLLRGHKTISMENEVVKIDIGANLIKVDCQFVFHNKGPACRVRMGFPDVGFGADFERSDQNAKLRPPKGTFLSYISYVDGRRVPVQTFDYSGDKPNVSSGCWHVKTVDFKPNATRLVHDIYTLEPGSYEYSVNNRRGCILATGYILHTASSWRGNVGRAEIDIHFNTKNVKAPLQLIRLKSNDGFPENRAALVDFDWIHSKKHTIFYTSPAQASAQGRTIRIICNDIRPTANDDINLYYEWDEDK